MAPHIEGLGDLHELGRGGSGVVYRAHQAAFGRDVAVKVIPGGGVDSEAAARFERECRATGAVSGHPNIVRVYGAGVTEDGDLYLVMDLLTGGTLADRVRNQGPLDLGRALSLGVGLAGALETAHRAGIVHRDVKPENVLFSAFGEAQLVDFGIARMQNAYESRTGSVSATLAHAAPEVLAGADASPRSDVYSLGSLLHFALAGKAPFARGTEASLLPLMQRISGEPPPDLRPHGVPDAVAGVIERAMAKDPSARFDSAAALGEALRVAGETGAVRTGAVPVAAPIPAAEVSPGPPTEPAGVTNATLFRARDELAAPAPPVPPPGSDWRRLLLAGAVVAAILLALVAVVVTRGDEEEDLAATSPTSTTASTDLEPTTTLQGETTTTLDPGTTTSSTETPPPPPRTTTTRRPTTTSGTRPPVSPPGAVADPRSADAVPVEEVNGVPERLRITLSWRPPADTGGQDPTEYRIRCTLMQSRSGEPTRVYDGPGEPAPCRGGVDFGTTRGNVTSFQPVVERVEPGPQTWLKWEVTPVNGGGAGPSTAVVVVVPDFVGMKSWEAFPVGRVLGLAVSGGQKSCGRESSTVCEQSRAPGSVLAGGSNVALFFQP